MSIRLKYHEEFNQGLKRLALDECNTAIREIENAEDVEDDHQAIHESRKAFKKIRAILRLTRFHSGFYKRENVFFRDLGRKISELRDRSSHLETLELIKQQYHNKLYANTFDTVFDQLFAYRSALAEKQIDQDDILADIADVLKAKKLEIEKWPLEVASFKPLYKGIKKVYQRSRKGFRNSKKTGEIEDFHEWRKRVKYLRYQIDILNRIWPAYFKTLEDEMHELTDLIGHLHDLHNLKSAVREIQVDFASPEEKLLFKSLINQQMKLMQEHSLLLGEKIFAQGAESFCTQLEQCWNSYQKELAKPDMPPTDSLTYD